MNNIGFSDITKLYLPKSCAVDAFDWMYNCGKRYVEGVALWAGVREGESFYIKKTIIPQQKAGNLEDGLIYFVDGEELHRISLELFDTGMQMIAQIHSHPNEAYHSETDDAYPIVTAIGGVSVVVPNFAKGGLNLYEWAVYRYFPESGWTELNEKDKTDFIQIIDDMPAQSSSRSKPFKFWLWR